MAYSVQEVIRFVDENDVKFIRLAFCDICGQLKNISITPKQLKRAFTHGIAFNSYKVKGFSGESDEILLLFPDSSTLTVLPWRPQVGRVIRFFCDVRHLDGTPFECDGRRILKEIAQKAKGFGFKINIGTKCEFYLFNLDEHGNPTKEPLDNATYFDVSPLDKGENIRREICLTLEEMGFDTEQSYHEQGPGQNEIDFHYSDASAAADNFITFKSAVKTVSSINGLHASFMPKPFSNKSGNGMHVMMSIEKDGTNILEGNRISTYASYFIAGILNRISEITAFLNPTVNSYTRFGSFEAPKYITWTESDSTQLLSVGNDASIVLRSADTTLTPYLSFALIIAAGLEGVEKKAALCAPANVDDDKFKNAEMLPETLGDAISAAEKSDFVKSIISPRAAESYLRVKRAEWDTFCNLENKSVMDERYFVSL